jgi:hypothetical protein
LYPLEADAWWRHRVTNPKTGVSQCPDKVVQIEGGAVEIPLRPQVRGFKAARTSAEEKAERWQEITASGDIHRHVDQWFDLDGNPTRIEYFCSRRLRVPDPSNGVDVHESFLELAVEPLDGETTLAQACLDLSVDQDTCEPHPEADHTACTLTGPETAEKYWTFEDQAEVEVAALDDAPPSCRFARRNAPDDEEPKLMWWTRGIGKLREETPAVEFEELIDYCLPADGCTRPAPTHAELAAEQGCP